MNGNRLKVIIGSGINEENMAILMRLAVNEANPNILIGLVPGDDPRFLVIPLPRTQGVACAGDALRSPFLGFVVV